MKSRKLSDEIAINKVISVLNIRNKKFNRDVEFLGFLEGKYVTAQSTHLILRCKIHNCTWTTTTFSNFTKRVNEDLRCEYCLEDKYINTPEKALNKVLEVHKNDKIKYDYSNILKEFENFDSYVTVICPIHGEFKIQYRTLLRGCGSHRKQVGGICPKCKKTNNLPESDALIKIKKALEIRNKIFNNDLEFLGFVGGKYINSRTKLILRCNKHNEIFETVCYNTLTNPRIRGPLCPVCNKDNKIKRVSKYEKECLDEVRKYIDEKDMFPQHAITSVYNEELNKYTTLFIDIFINSIFGIILIEYDGEQHTRRNTIFHSNYQYFVNQVNRDNFLKRLCEKNGWKLLRISYKDNNRIPEIIKVFFEEGKDITTKVEPKLLPILYGQDIIS